MVFLVVMCIHLKWYTAVMTPKFAAASYRGDPLRVRGLINCRRGFRELLFRLMETSREPRSACAAQYHPGTQSPPSPSSFSSPFVLPGNTPLAHQYWKWYSCSSLGYFWLWCGNHIKKNTVSVIWGSGWIFVSDIQEKISSRNLMNLMFDLMCYVKNIVMNVHKHKSTMKIIEHY